MVGQKNSENKKNQSTRDFYWKGSYTVEAAAVIPMTFLVLAAIIICSFYVHDRAVFQGAACEAAATGSNYMTEKERQSAVSKVKKKVTGTLFLGSRGISGNTSSGKKEVNASFSGTYPIPGMVMKFYSGGSFQIKKSWSGKIPDPAETIRLVRGAERIIRGVM